MVTVNRHDLEFILAQIKIAERHAAGEQLYVADNPASGLVVDTHLPYGLRTVDGTYNNLIPGRETWGSADQPMPRLTDANWITADRNRDGVVTDYGVRGSTVYDADPRVISNLVADQSLGNIAAVSAALLKYSTLDPGAIVGEAQAIVDLYGTYMTALRSFNTINNNPLSTPDQVQTAQTALDNARNTLDVKLNDPTINIVPDPSPDGELNVRIPDVAPDEGLTAPFNTWMTLFGQFFDHGLDLVAKGGAGTVYIPLQPDDPLYVPGSFTNFMVLTRASTTLPGADGEMGTADDIIAPNGANRTTPWVDQNQTYSSHASHQVFLREYKMVDNPAYPANPDAPPKIPVPTGNLLEGQHHGMATWADLKLQAKTMLGIDLSDFDVHGVPLLATDEYGNLQLDAAGRVMMIRDVGGVATAVPTSYLAPMKTVDAINGHSIMTGHAFLEDIAHLANPGTFDLNFDPNTFQGGNMVADSDVAVILDDGTVVDDAIGLAGDNLSLPSIPFGPNGTVLPVRTAYDNELLDKHYMAGDGRANENFGLTAVHHIFHSEHNRQVDAMKATILASAVEARNSDDPAQIESTLTFLNEWLATDVTSLDGVENRTDLNWDGSRLFQSARFATEMQYQHMVFEEFGRRVHPAIDAFVFNSITDIDPAIVAEFAHVVYRFGHSMLTENVATINFDGVNEIRTDLIGAFLNPVAFETLGSDTMTDAEAAGAVIRGTMRETGNAIDEFVTSALRNNLVGLPLDLAALNIARGRETGMPTLQQARETFYESSGSDWLKPYTSWADFAVNLKNPASLINFIAAYGTHPSLLATVAVPPSAAFPTGQRPLTVEERRDIAIKLVLGDPALTGQAATDFNDDRLDFLNATGNYAGGSLGGLNNVDFWIGGLAEKIMPFGGMLGSSFAFVFEVTMENLQNNDRFYYLTRTQGLNMLNELENNSFASIIMKNTDFGLGGSHLPGEMFADVDYILEMDANYQIDELPGAADIDPFLVGLGRQKFEREVGLVGPERIVGAREYDNRMSFLGGEHVVLGGTNFIDGLFGGRDILIGDIGDDTAWGDGGDDLIIGGAGVNHLHGGAGNDIILDGGDVSFLHGDDGDDVLHSGAGAAELIFGGDGNDVLIMGEDDAKHATAGEGNDFLLGGAGADILSGNEGDDWIEGKGGFDVISGDNSELFFNSTIIGHDIMFAGDNETDFDAESGDDIMVMGESVIRAEGMFGFDWVTYKDVRVSADLDLNRKIFATDQQDVLRNRFDRVEGASGFDQNDYIWGDDRSGGDLDPAVTLGQNETTLAGHELTQEGIDRIEGLRDVLGDYVNDVDASFTKGNILLGGGGSDTIMGRGGDDFIDGDHWLNVRIEVTPTTGDVFSIDSLSEIMPQLLSGEIRPDQLRMVREVVNGVTDLDVDTAEFWDVRENYQITKLTDGTVIVTHLTESDPADLGFTEAAGLKLFNEGTDTLRGIEKLKFADVTLDVGADLVADNPTTGTITISDTTPTNGLPLSVTFALNDLDVNPALLNVAIQWQFNHDGTWTDIEGATGPNYTPDEDIGVEQLRVRITATEPGAVGNQTILYSAPTAPVGENIVGEATAETIIGSIGADLIDAAGGADTVNGGLGDDTIQGGTGDDTIIWSAEAAGNGGRDLINGGGNDALGDTFQVNGDTTSETFHIMTATAFVASAFAGPLAAGTEIVVLRNGVVIAELDSIEEIVVNGTPTGPANGTTVVGADTIIVDGDFGTTSLNLNTITINGGTGDDEVDITSLGSAHRIVFRTKGGNDVIVGTLRAQDVIELPTGSDPASYTPTANSNGTVTMSNGTHSVTFAGSLADLPDLVVEDDEPDTDDDNGNGSGGGVVTPPPVTEGVVLMPGSTAGVQVGDANDDVIVGGEQGDALLGKGGADIILGNGGNDVGLGGSGGDTIEGGAGRDVLLGGAGDDLIIAQNADGADMIFGGAGSDTLDLSAVTEGVTVDLGAYTAIGTVRAGSVTDHLIGVENVVGSQGADVIKAALGINVMTGGDGEDIFVFVSAGTANGDVITDFRPGDKIDLSGIDAMVGVNGNQTFTLSDVATTAAGNLVIREVATADGVDTIIDGFTDGDADVDFSITLRGAHNLTGSSFDL
jgi:Ca2+-binding RTX toxin-like protein